jgi:hypothetical protein
MGTYFSSFRQYFVEALQWSTNNETHIDVFKEFFIDAVIDFLNFTHKNIFIKRGFKYNLNSLMYSKNKQLTGNTLQFTKYNAALNLYNRRITGSFYKSYKRSICYTATNHLSGVTTVAGLKKKRVCQFNKIVLKSHILCKDL